MQGMQLHPLANFFEQNWLDLDKYGWIWSKLRQNLGKIEAKFGHK